MLLLLKRMIEGGIDREPAPTRAEIGHDGQAAATDVSLAVAGRDPVDVVAAHPGDLRIEETDAEALLKSEAALAEQRGKWSQAAAAWGKLAARSSGTERLDLQVKQVRAWLAARKFLNAEKVCYTALANEPVEPALLHLHAEVAAAQKSWLLVLERWFRLELVSARHKGRLPLAWVFQIGIKNVLKQQAGVTIPHLQATGHLAISRAFEMESASQAVWYARKARKAYRSQCAELVVRILIKETRYEAALWWLRRAATPDAAGRRHFPPLVNTLMEMADFEAAEAVAKQYGELFGDSLLRVRCQSEILFRRGALAELTEFLQAETSSLIAKAPGVSPLAWIIPVFGNHPRPPSLLPAETVAAMLAFSARHDKKETHEKLRALFAFDTVDPRDRETSQGVAKNTGYPGARPLVEEAQRLLNRRDWVNLESLVCGLDLDRIPASDHQLLWPFFRIRTDFLLGAGRFDEAEETCVRFVEKITEKKQHHAIVQNARNLLGRLPYSDTLVSHVGEAARRGGFKQTQAYMEEWASAFQHHPPPENGEDGVRKRCFIVGNAPSIANFPLEKLQGETIFCVNRGMRAESWGLPKPRYLVVGDDRVFKSYKKEILRDAQTVERCFIAANCLWGHKLQAGIETFGLSGFKYSLRPFQFSAACFHRGETVVIIAAQIAHLMGFQDIYFLGVDLDYSGPQTHFYADATQEGQRLSNFKPGGIGTELANLAFENLQTVLQPEGCSLYNAAPAGNLNAIPRVHFPTLVAG